MTSQLGTQKLPSGDQVTHYADFDPLQRLIHAETGIAIRNSKVSMLATRLERRLKKLGIGSFKEYHQYLLECGPESREYRDFIDCITTNKTAFFREAHHFKFLADQLRTLAKHSPIRIWSSACSSGQEPYSIAMTAARAIGPLSVRDFRILASDINTRVLHDAEQGLYSVEQLAEIPSQNRQLYCRLENSGSAQMFRICEELREIVSFRRKNLISTAWDIRTTFDFIFCRNALIYFDRDTQEQIVRRFISFLKPNGYLILGHSEHLQKLNDVLEPIGRTVYKLRSFSLPGG